MLDARQITQLRRRLLTQRRDCRGQIERLRRSTFGQSQRGTVGELSTYDNHPADLGTETYERSRDLGLLGEAREEYREIDAALDRMQRGKYGRCLRCGSDISFARLWAVPTATQCRDCLARR